MTLKDNIQINFIITKRLCIEGELTKNYCEQALTLKFMVSEWARAEVLEINVSGWAWALAHSLALTIFSNTISEAEPEYTNHAQAVLHYRKIN